MNLGNSKPQLVPELELSFIYTGNYSRMMIEYYKFDDEFGAFYYHNYFCIVNQKGKIIIQQKIKMFQEFAYQKELKYLAIYLHNYQESDELKIIDLKTQKTVSQKIDNTIIKPSVFAFHFSSETLILMQDSVLQFFSFNGQKRAQAIKIECQNIERAFLETRIVNNSLILLKYANIAYKCLLNFALIYIKNGKCCRSFQRKAYYHQINQLNESIAALYYRSYESYGFYFQLINLQGKILRMLKYPFNNETFNNVLRTSFINNEYYIFLKDSYLKVSLIKGVIFFFEFSLGDFGKSSFPLSEPFFSSIVVEPINPLSKTKKVIASIFKFEV